MEVVNASPTVMLNDAARGLAQQMVFWGHDVRHPEGNALVRFGLLREPSPGLQGTSCYSMEWENGRIEVHGAMASWTAPADGMGCVFSRNTRRLDLWAASKAPVPGTAAGITGSAASGWNASMPLIRWLAFYETWVFATLGPAWRDRTWRALKRLPKGKPWLAPDLALRWWELAASGGPPRPREME